VERSERGTSTLRVSVDWRESHGPACGMSFVRLRFAVRQHCSTSVHTSVFAGAVRSTPRGPRVSSGGTICDRLLGRGGGAWRK